MIYPEEYYTASTIEDILKFDFNLTDDEIEELFEELIK